MSRARGAKPKPKTKSKSAKGGKTKTASVEELVEQGTLAMTRMELELACKFFSTALESEPSNTSVMDALADALLQMGDEVGALELLQQSTSLAPSENPVKWFFLAQLKEGQDALECYRTAIRLLEETIIEPSANGMIESEAGESGEPANKLLSRAHCSVAELYLTDLCYDDGAETQCEAALNSALKADPNSLEAFQTLASLRLSQCRGQEATEVVSRVSQKLLEGQERMIGRAIVDELSGVGDDSETPTLQFTVGAIKLCLECVVFNRSLANTARSLAENLLVQDDELIEVWYLLGLACSQLSDPDLGSAAEGFGRAKALLDQIRVQLIAEGRWLENREVAMDGEPDSCSKNFSGTPETRACEDEEAQHYVTQYRAVVEQLEAVRANPNFGKAWSSEAELNTAAGNGSSSYPTQADSIEMGNNEEDEEWSTEDEDDMET